MPTSRKTCHLHDVFSMQETEYILLCPLFCVFVCLFFVTMSNFFVTPWSITCQSPLSVLFPRQESWSTLLFPSPGDFPSPGIEPISLESPAVITGCFTTDPPGKTLAILNWICHWIQDITIYLILSRASNSVSFPGSSAGKESTCNAQEPISIPGWGRSPEEGIGYPLYYSWASLVAQTVKNSPALRETWIWFLGWEDSLEKDVATQSSIIAQRTPMDRGAWKATAHDVTMSQTQLSTAQWFNKDTYLCSIILFLKKISCIRVDA